MNILWFQDCSHNDKQMVGGKNASLGELKRISESLNINIGNGFAITTTVYDTFCSINNINNLIDEELKKISLDDIESIENASAKIKSFFKNARLPKRILHDIRDAYCKLNHDNGGQIKDIAGPYRFKVLLKTATFELNSTGTSYDLTFAVADEIAYTDANYKIPTMAYQVSGEYSLLTNGINKGFVDEDIILESLIAFKRAGANAIVSYYADRIDKLLK